MEGFPLPFFCRSNLMVMSSLRFYLRMSLFLPLFFFFYSGMGRAGDGGGLSHFWRIVLLEDGVGWVFFSFSNLHIPFHCLLSCKVCVEKSAYNLTEELLHITSCLSLWLDSFVRMCFDVGLWAYFAIEVFSVSCIIACLKSWKFQLAVLQITSLPLSSLGLPFVPWSTWWCPIRPLRPVHSFLLLIISSFKWPYFKFTDSSACSSLQLNYFREVFNSCIFSSFRKIFIILVSLLIFSFRSCVISQFHLDVFQYSLAH